jgi:uncharacterized protein (DUF433 family)
MDRTDWRQRVTTDRLVHHGEPCVVGTRIPVRILIGSLADGRTPAEILADYPQLSLADLHAALAYAAELLRQETIVPWFDAEPTLANQAR